LRGHSLGSSAEEVLKGAIEYTPKTKEHQVELHTIFNGEFYVEQVSKEIVTIEGPFHRPITPEKYQILAGWISDGEVSIYETCAPTREFTCLHHGGRKIETIHKEGYQRTLIGD
jgi:hypothetical protein